MYLTIYIYIFFVENERTTALTFFPISSCSINGIIVAAIRASVQTSCTINTFFYSIYHSTSGRGRSNLSTISFHCYTTLSKVYLSAVFIPVVRTIYTSLSAHFPLDSPVFSTPYVANFLILFPLYAPLKWQLFYISDSKCRCSSHLPCNVVDNWMFDPVYSQHPHLELHFYCLKTHLYLRKDFHPLRRYILHDEILLFLNTMLGFWKVYLAVAIDLRISVS